MSEYFVKLRSNYLDSTIDLNIIMPNPFVGHDPEKFYRSGKKFPVLWLLHGGAESFANLLTYSSIPRLGIFKNTIIVAPDVPNCDFVDQPLVGEGYNFTQFFYHELMPFIYNWFPASSEPGKNFLAGASMGCEATWRQGLMHPEAFGCIAPLGEAPKDYRSLEPYRDVPTVEFRKAVLQGEIKNQFGGEKLRRRELNTICKYALIEDFLNSAENTLARFEEAAVSGKLPNVYMTGEKEKLSGFQKYTEELGVNSITFALKENIPEGTAFWEEAVEDFMNFVGLENVEKNDGSAPILSGANEFEDEENGITLH